MKQDHRACRLLPWLWARAAMLNDRRVALLAVLALTAEGKALAERRSKL